MAYSNRNLLERIIEIQEITLQYKDKGYFQKWIYENVIHEKFKVSYSTFNNYLSRNAKKEHSDIGRAKSETN